MTEIEKLLTLQTTDLQIRAVQAELNDIPARKKAEELRLKEHREALEAAEARLKAQQVSIKNLEGDVQVNREKIAKLRQQQMTLKTNKEFKAMEEEVSGVQSVISSLEDRELVLMEEMEMLRDEVAARQSDLKQEESALAVDVDVLDKRAGELSVQLEKEQKDRAALASDIDREWLSRYETIISRRDKAIVSSNGGNCGGCHMKLPPAVVNGVKRRDQMTCCDFCGRLLY